MARVVLLLVALHAQWVMESSVGRYPVEDVVGITGESRTYHGVTVAQLKETKWTHVSVCGKVTLAKKEDDGDAHIRIEAGGAFAVAEIVPYHPLPMPKVGQWVRVAGISRYDKTHAWPEVHPVEAVSVVGSCST